MLRQAVFVPDLHWAHKNKCVRISWCLATSTALIAGLLPTRPQAGRCAAGFVSCAVSLLSQPCCKVAVGAHHPKGASTGTCGHLGRELHPGGCSALSLAMVAFQSSTASQVGPRGPSLSPHFTTPLRKLPSPGQGCHQGSVTDNGSSGSIIPGLLPYTSGTPWQLTLGLGLSIPDHPTSSAAACLYATHMLHAIHTRDNFNP